MTTEKLLIGATLTVNSSTTWSNIPWKRAKRHVFRLQMRIAKAKREKKTGKVKSLQRILTHSFYAKTLAVKQVTSNTGKNTPGIDGKIWRTDLQKLKAVDSLKRRGYNPLPLRRIYIPKKQDKFSKRPLSIPAMKDRAMQALWLLALNPIAEEMADPNSYGFRSKRSTQDAIEQCFLALSRKRSSKYVLEGDIKACFDTISHDWLLENIPMDKTILRKFLKAGFMEKDKIYPTISGISQGGAISPCLTLITLSGLEEKLVSKNSSIKKKEKINFIGYADDFVVTAENEELLNTKVVPRIEEFLKERGLELSRKKTKVTHIEEGFDFLGFNIRKYKNDKLLIKPSKANIKNFVREIKTTIKINLPLQTDKLILLLNSKIVGWCNYYKNVVSSQTFSHIDYRVFKLITFWTRRRHPNKGKYWINRKYFTSYGLNNWRFHANFKDKNGIVKPVLLKLASHTNIKRHVKIRGAANPFNPEYKTYFEQRDKKDIPVNTRILLGGS